MPPALTRPIRVLWTASVFALACADASSPPALDESGQASSPTPTETIACPTPYVIGTGSETISASVRTDAGLSGDVTWSITSGSATLSGLVDGKSATQNGTASATFSATELGNVTIKAAWSTSLSKTCTIVVVNPTATLNCPKSFTLATPEPNISLTLADGTTPLTSNAITWTSTGPATLDTTPTNSSATDDTGTSSVGLIATTTGSTKVTAAWGDGTGESTSCTIPIVNPTVALKCPTSFVPDSEPQTLSITVKSGTTDLSSYPIVWSSNQEDVVFGDVSDGGSSPTGGNGISTATFSASTVGETATVTASWGSGATESASCNIKVINPTSDGLSCPKTFVAGSAAQTLTLTLKDASAGVAEIPVTWSSNVAPASGADTSGSGVSTATFSSTTAGPVTVTASWGFDATPASCRIVVEPAAAVGVNPTCPGPLVAGTTGEATLALADTYGNPVSEAVKWTATKGATLKTLASSSKSDTSGNSVIDVSSNTATASTPYTITAAYAAGGTGSASTPYTCTVSVSPAPLDVAKSTLTVSAATVKAGVPVTITATAKDTYGNTDTNATVAVSVAGPGTFGASGTSISGSGVATGSLASDFAGTDVVTATVSENGNTTSLPVKKVVVTTAAPGQSLSYLFFPFSNQTGTTTTKSGGTGLPVYVDACFFDTYGNPLTGDKVTFAGSATGNTFTPNSAVTSDTGCASTAMTTTSAGTQNVQATQSGVTVSTLENGDSASVTFDAASVEYGTNAPIRTGEGKLTLEVNGVTVSSTTSTQSVTVSYKVKNYQGALVPDGTSCTFYARTTQSPFAADATADELFWGTTGPYFEGGSGASSGDYFVASVTSSTSGGTCTAVVIPALAGWSVLITAEADGVVVGANDQTGSVIETTTLTVTSGATPGIELGTDGDFLPADSKTTTPLYVWVGDGNGNPLGGIAITLTATGSSACDGSNDIGGDLVFGASHGSTASSGLTSEASAATYIDTDGYFTTTVKASHAGCYVVTATVKGTSIDTMYSLQFVKPVATATMSVTPPTASYDGNDVLATVTVTDATDNPIPGQTVEFPTDLLGGEGFFWDGSQEYWQDDGANGAFQCGADMQNRCVLTDDSGVASIYLYPDSPWSNTPAPIVAFVHAGTLGSEDDGFFQSDWATGAPLAMTPVVAEPSQTVARVDYSESLVGVNNDGPTSAPADGVSTITLFVGVEDMNYLGVAGVPVSITTSTTGQGVDFLSPTSPSSVPNDFTPTDSLSGTTGSDGKFWFTIASTEIQSEDGIQVSIGNGLANAWSSVSFTPPYSASYTGTPVFSAPTDESAAVSITVQVTSTESVVGLPVSVTTEGGAEDTVTVTNSSTTDQNGMFTVTIVSATAQQWDDVSIIINNGSAALFPVVTFYPPLGQPSTFTTTGSTASTLTATPSSLGIDPSGATTTSLVVTVQDASGTAQGGVAVTLTTNGTGNSFCAVGTAPCSPTGTISGVTATDGSGTFTVTLSSSTAQTETISAAIGSPTSLTLTTNVTFLPPATFTATSALAVPAWTALASYSPGDFVNVTDSDTNVWTLVCIAGGTASNSASTPSWPVNCYPNHQNGPCTSWNTAGQSYSENQLGGDGSVVWSLVGPGAIHPQFLDSGTIARHPIAPWASGFTYAVGDFVTVTDSSQAQWTLVNESAPTGTSSGTEPTWPTSWTPGQTVLDGSITWAIVAQTAPGSVPADGTSAYLLAIVLGAGLDGQTVIGTDTQAGDTLSGLYPPFGGLGANPNMSGAMGSNLFVDMGGGVYVASFASLTPGSNTALDVTLNGDALGAATPTLTFFPLSSVITCGSLVPDANPPAIVPIGGQNHVDYGPASPANWSLGGLGSLNGQMTCGDHVLDAVPMVLSVFDPVTGAPVAGVSVQVTGLGSPTDLYGNSLGSNSPSGTTDSNGQFAFIENGGGYDADFPTALVNGTTILPDGASYFLIVFGG